MKFLAPAVILLLASGCATAPGGVLPDHALEASAGEGEWHAIRRHCPAAALTRLFGAPNADVREGNARKLQFQSRICVLDTYLYPKGSSEPRVTYVDARQPDGRAIDRASCVAALTRREGGK